jgi:hypothetical protein
VVITVMAKVSPNFSALLIFPRALSGYGIGLTVQLSYHYQDRIRICDLVFFCNKLNVTVNVFRSPQTNALRRFTTWIKGTVAPD